MSPTSEGFKLTVVDVKASRSIPGKSRVEHLDGEKA